MPNHVSTNLTITGPSNDVHSFVTKVDSSLNTPEDYFDFQGVVPMPSELRAVSAPTKIQSQTEINGVWADYNTRKELGQLTKWELVENRPWDLGITKETSKDLIQKYGSDNWYNWAFDNWGTKWGAYDATEWQFENGGKAANISFNTAWGSATPFIKTVSLLFPTLRFEMEYADEGGEFVREMTCENGKLEEVSHEWESDDGVRVRSNVGYGPSEEIDEDEFLPTNP